MKKKFAHASVDSLSQNLTKEKEKPPAKLKNRFLTVLVSVLISLFICTAAFLLWPRTYTVKFYVDNDVYYETDISVFSIFGSKKLEAEDIPNPAGFTPDGYEFLGWYEYINAGTTREFSLTGEAINKSISLYASFHYYWIPVPTPAGLVYTGNPQTPFAETDDYSVTCTPETDAGTYTAVLSLKDPSKEWAGGSKADKTVSWTISKAERTNKVFLSGWTWGSETNNPILTGAMHEEEDSNYTLSFYYYTIDGRSLETKPTNAGTYLVRAAITETANYAMFLSEPLQFTIAPSGTVAIPSNPADIVYNGRPQAPEMVHQHYHVYVNEETNIGTYTMLLSLKDSHNFAWSDGTQEDITLTWKITPLQLQVPQITSGDFTYDRFSHTATIEPSPFYSVTGNVQTNAGNYLATVTITNPNCEWAGEPGSRSSKELPWRIFQAAGEGSVDIADWTYGQTAPNPTPISDKNGTGSVTYLYEGRDGTVYGPSAEKPVNAGQYILRATFAETQNYAAVTATCNFSIARAKLSIDLQYQVPTTSPTVYSPNLKLSDISIIGSPSDIAGAWSWEDGSLPLEAGSGQIFRAVFVSASSNYLSVTVGVNVDILQAKATFVQTETFAYTYGDTLGSKNSILANETASVSGTFVFKNPTETPNAGTTSAVVVFTPSGTNNYSASEFSLAIRVGQAELTVRASSGQAKVYGADDPVFAYEASGWKFGPLAFIGALIRQGGEDVGDYAIGRGNLTADPNYSILFIGDSFSITAAELVLTAKTNQTKVYGSADPVFAFDADGWKLGDGKSLLTGALDREGGEDAGGYLIGKGNVSAGANYTITFKNATFAITPKTLTITATPNQSKIYGESDNPFSYVVTGWERDDDESLIEHALTRAAGEPAGTYAILKGNLNAGNNYTITYVGATFTILPKVLTVTATSGLTKTYGDSDPVFSYLASGWEFGDNEALLGLTVPERQMGESVGIYSIAKGTLAVSGGNYTINFIGSTFEIQPAILTITAHANAKVYGSADPAFTYSSSGFKRNDTASLLSGELSRTTPTVQDAGTYSTRQGTLKVDSTNYSIIFIPAEFTITPAALTVTADSDTKVYNTADPAAFTYKAVGFKYSENYGIFSGELIRESGENTGSYIIRQGSLTAGGNYTITFISSFFTITKASRTNTVSMSGWTYGGAEQSPSLEGIIHEQGDPSFYVEFYYDKSQTGTFLSTQRPSNAGTYYVRAVIGETANYMAYLSPAVAFTITKATAIARPSNPADLIYDTSTQLPEIAANDNYTIAVAARTDAGTYSATVTLNDPSNYYWAGEGDATAPITLTWKIVKAQIAIPAVNSSNFVYDGNVHSPAINANNAYTITDNIQVDAGVYYAKVALKNTANYRWEGSGDNTAPLNLKWEIEQLKIDRPTVTITEFTYNGSVRTLAVAINEYYDIVGSQGTNANTYSAKVTLNNPLNVVWKGNTATNTDPVAIEWKIKPHVVKIPAVTSNDFVYDGSIHIPSISVSTYYTITGNSQSAAGTYFATVTLNNQNYIWEDDTEEDLKLEWTILKATRTNTVSFAGWTFGSAANNPEIIGANHENGLVTYAYYRDEECTDVLPSKPTGAGIYYVKATIAATGNYYALTTAAVRFIIAPENTTPRPANPADLAYHTNPQTPNIVPNANYDITYYSDFNCENQIPGATNAGTYYALAALKDTNHTWDDDTTAAVKLVWVIKKAERTNIITLAGWDVDKTANSPSVGTVPDLAESGVTVTYYYSSAYGGPYTTSRPTEAGDYYVYAFITEGSNYNELQTEKRQFTIAVPEYTLTFVTNGGTAVAQIIQDYHTGVNMPVTTLAGNTFLGWYSNNTFTGNAIDWGTYRIVGNETFYAKWRLNVLSVNYNYDNGTGTPATENVNYGSGITLPVPTKKGYTFLGWTGGILVNANGLKTAQEILTNIATADRLIELVAQWQAKTLTILYDANGGNGIMTASSPFSYSAATSGLISACTYTAADSYQTFWHWTVNADGTGEVVVSSMTMSQLWDIAQTSDEAGNKTLTLYAQWDTIFEMGGTQANGIITGIKAGAAVPSNLVIPATVVSKVNGITYTVTAIGDAAFENKSTITSVIIPAQITSIGLGAFKGCTNLAAITIPYVGQSASSNKFFGYIFGALAYLNQGSTTYVPSGLKTVTLLSGNIPDNAFYGCENIVTFHLPANCTVIGNHAFKYCAGVTGINMPDNLAAIGTGAFSNCTSLEFMDLSNTAVTEIPKDAFANCTDLLEITLHQNTVQIGESAFAGSLSLELVNNLGAALSLIDASAFSGCIALERINLANTGVLKISASTFSGCAALVSVTLPSSLQQIENSAFYGCTALQSIVIPNTVRTFGSTIFSGCIKLQTITLPFTNANYIALFSGLRTDLTINFTAASGYTDLSDGRFSGFDGSAAASLPKLVAINLPDNLQTIGTSAFSGCNGLTAIGIPSTVTLLGDKVFENCTALRTVTFVAISALGTLGAQVFKGCTGLVSITIPDSVTAMGNNLFEGSGIQTITAPMRSIDYQNILSGFENDLTLIFTATGVLTLPDNSFADFNGTSGRPNLKSITLPNLTAIGDNAFKNCTGLTAITVPATVTTLGASCFEGSGLTGIDLTLTEITQIPDGAFKNCIALTANNILLKSTTTHIGNSAFENCTGIAGTFAVVNSVTTIGAFAFGGCTGLTAIYLPSSLAAISVTALRGSNSLIKVQMPLLEVSGLYGQLFTGIGGTSKDFEVVFLSSSSTRLVSYAFSGFNGTANKPKLTDITLPGNLTEIGVSAFEDCSALKEILVPAGVHTAEDAAFKGCSGLLEMDLSDTFVTAISDHTFENCTAIVTVTLRDDITAIGASAFENCLLLKKVILEGHDINVLPGDVYDIGEYAFYGCAALESIDLSSTGVQVISESAFENCIKLSSILLPSGLEEIQANAFKGCVKLTELEIPNNNILFGLGIFAGAGLAKITMPFTDANYGSVFSGLATELEVIFTVYSGSIATTLSADRFKNFNGTAQNNLPSLAKITLPDNLKIIGANAFENCWSLGAVTGVNIPASVETINANAFKNCTYLKSISLQQGLLTLGASVFYGCESLTTVVIPNSVTLIGNNLFESSGVTNVTMPIRNLTYPSIFLGYQSTAELTLSLTLADTSIPVNAFANFNGTGTRPRLISVSLPSGLLTISSGAFLNCSYLQGISIPSSVTTIGSSAFEGCSVLGSIDLSALTGLSTVSASVFKDCVMLSTVELPSSATRINDSAFENCRTLNGITIPATVNFIGVRAFFDCRSLTSIDLSKSGVLALATISRSAFENCYLLSTVHLPSNTSEIQDRAFANCLSLTEIEIPNNAVTYGSSIFAGSNLSQITMPLAAITYANMFTGLTTDLQVTFTYNGVTAAVSQNAFLNFYNSSVLPALTSVTIKSGITSIGASAFSGCGELAAVDMPNTIAQIGSLAFAGCFSLGSAGGTVTLSSGLTALGDQVFSGCRALTSIIIPNGVTAMGSSLFENSGISDVTMPLRPVSYSSIFLGFGVSSPQLVLTLTQTSETTVSADAFAKFNGSDTLPKLKSITMPNNLTSLGDRALQNCSYLTTVNLYSGLLTIGGSAFQNCSSLQGISVPSSVTAIGASAFAGCSKLMSINLSALLGLSTISASTFENCILLETALLPTSILTISSRAFYNCSVLDNISIPSNVNLIGSEAFKKCSALQKIDLSGASAAGLSVISTSAFEDCLSLSLVTLPINTSEIQEKAFAGCSSLQSISIPSSANVFGINVFSGSGLKTIAMPFTSANYQTLFNGLKTNLTIVFNNSTAGTYSALSANAFQNFNGQGNTPNLQQVTLPATVLTTIGVSAFAGSGLTSVNTTNTVIATIEANAFEGCASLITATIGSTTATINSSAFADCIGLTTFSVGSGIRTMGNLVFDGCLALNSVTLAEGLTAIGTQAFKGCTALRTIILPNSALSFGTNLFEGSGVNTVTMPLRPVQYEYVLSGFTNNLTLSLSATTETDLPNNSFYNFNGSLVLVRPNLINITLPSNIQNIGETAFKNCINLTQISMHSGLKNIGIYAFENSGLLAIDLSGTLVREIAEGTFKNCTGLNAVKFDNNVNTIDDSAFYGCSSLGSIDIPSNIDYIGAYAFYGCRSLLKIDLSLAGSTNLAIVSESAFEGCTLLNEVKLPANLSDIENNAFAGCSSLLTFSIPNNNVTFGLSIFAGAGVTKITMPFTDANYANIFNGLSTVLEIVFTVYNDSTSPKTLSATAFQNFNGSLNKPTLSAITLPSNLTSIGASAFSGCSGLGSGGITIPAGVLSIGGESFKNCSVLGGITFTGNVQSLGDRVFSGCRNLTAIEIPTSVTAVGENVFEKSGMTTVSMPARNDFVYSSIFNGFEHTPAVKSLALTLKPTGETVLPDGAFANFNGLGNTPSLSGITLPNDITIIGEDAFTACSELKTISLPGTIINIKANAFSFCTGLAGMDLSVTQITQISSGTFEGCSNLSSVIFKPGITSIGSRAFFGCSKLGTTITIPNSVSTIGANAFNNCTNLVTVNLGTGLTTISNNIFSGCTSITQVTMPLQNLSYTTLFNGTGGAAKELTVIFTNNLAATPIAALPENAFSTFNGTLGKPKLVSVTLPSNLTSIGNSAFENCAYLSTILTIPAGLSTIGEAAFAGCLTLGSMDLSHTQVKRIEHDTFNGCTLLSSVSLSDEVSYLGNRCFYACKNLLAITVPSNVANIGEYAFYQCEKLNSIDLSRGSVITGLSIVSLSAFEGCIALKNVTLPFNLTEIKDRAFANCTSLLTLDLPDSFNTFGVQVFSGSGLTTITLPFTNAVYADVFSGLQTSLTLVFRNKTATALRNLAFQNFNGTTTSNLPKLVSITLPTNLISIGDSAFYGCNGLTVVSIPDSVTSIGSSAFQSCTALHTITLSNTLTSLGDKVFSGCSAAAFTGMVIPASVTTMGSNLFESSSITTVSMPLRNAVSYQTILYGFTNNLTLTLISTGETVLHNGALANFTGTAGRPRLISMTISTSGITQIGSSAFENCTYLTTISFPSSLTLLGANCFKGSGLSSINLNAVTEIPDGAFQNCTGLLAVAFNASTSKIGNSAFENCPNMNTGTANSISLPNMVTTIGTRAFASCSNLTRISFGTGLVTVASNALNGNTKLVYVEMPLLSSVTSYADLFFGIGGTLQNFEVFFTSGTATTLIDSAFSGFNGGNSKPKLTAITLPGNLTAIGENAFASCTALSSIVIPDSVETLGDYCFYKCTSLNSINFASAKVKAIPEGAFMDCTLLITVTLSNVLTTETIGANAFANSGLQSMANINYDTLLSIGASAFYNSRLVSLNLGNTSLAEIKDSTFALCTNLTDISLPDSLQKIGAEAFYNCKLLGSQNAAKGSINILGNNNTLPSRVETVGSDAFKNCESLVGIRLSDTGIEDLPARVFMNCYELQWIYLPSGILTIGVSAFENDSKLAFVDESSSLQNIYASAFKGCLSLSELTMYNILSISPDALVDCNNLSDITMRFIGTLDYHELFYRDGAAGELNITFTDSNTDKVIGSDAFKGFNGTNGLPKLISITLPNNLTAIEARAFEDCWYLTNFTVPNTVNTIGEAAFRNCRNLTQFVLTATGVTEISDDTFSGCINLSQMSFNPLTTKIGDRAFQGCAALTDISGAGLTTSLTSIGISAFQSSGLLSVDLRTTGVKSIADNAFRSAQLTTALLNESTTYIGKNAFSANTNLGSVNIAALSSLVTIDNYAFSGCTALNQLILPSSVRTIGNFAFSGTSIGAGVVTLNSGLETIGNNAFERTLLSSLTIPVSLQNLGENIVAGCASLSTVILPLGDFNYRTAFTGITQNISVTLSATAITAVPNQAFQNFNGQGSTPNLISIILPANTASIGDYAFQNCTGLTTTIALPSTVLTIGDYSFAGTRITAINLTGTGVTVISSYAFSGCAYLTNVQLKTTTARIEAYAFSGCNILETISIPNTVNYIGSGAFQNTALSSVNLQNTGVTVIYDRVFQGTKISSITLNSATSSIGAYAFAGDTSLTTLNLSAYSSLATIGDYAFSGCGLLGSVTLNNTLRTIGSYAFAGTAISSITIPNTVTALGANLLNSCGNLANITMPLVNSTNFNYNSALTGITRATGINLTLVFVSDTVLPAGSFTGFNGTNNKPLLQSISLPSGLTEIGDNAFQNSSGYATINLPNTLSTIGEFVFAGSSLSSISLSSTLVSVISKNAFDGAASLTTVNLPTSGLLTIDDYAFQNCAMLSTMAIPSSLKTIGIRAFAGCIAYTSISLNSGLTTIGNNAFQGTTATSITIPATVISLGNDLFSGTTTLETITMPNGTGFNYQQIFNGFTRELTITFSSSVATLSSGAYSGFIGSSNKPRLIGINLTSGLTGISDNAFNGCTYLTQISIPGTVTAIGNYAFAGTGLTSLTLPEGLLTIGNYAFQNCKTLPAIITIPSTVTTIGNYAFAGCSTLTAITLPATANSIGDNVFSGCTSLTTLTLLRSLVVNGNVTTGSATLGMSGSAKIFVPSDSLTGYQALWTAHTGIITPSTPQITFNSNGGSAVSSIIDNYGSSINKPAPNPTKTGYIFENWYSDSSLTNVVSWPHLLVNHITFYAKWTPIEYTITWVDGNGNTLYTEEVAFGSMPAYSGLPVPTKLSTAEHTYTFNGTWSPAIAAVSGAATYQAQFDSTVNQYLVKWVDGDDNVLATEMVSYGSVPTAYSGASPAKSQTVSQTFAFTGWSPALAAINGATTYTAQFSPSTRQYLIRWLNDDGTVLDSAYVDYNGTPTYGGLTPMKSADEQYSYAFAGWSPSISTVSGAADYTATFTSTEHQLTLTYNANGGSGTLSGSSALYSGNITVEGNAFVDPSASGEMTFAGWNTQADGEGTFISEGTVLASSLWSLAAGTGNKSLTLYAIWL